MRTHLGSTLAVAAVALGGAGCWPLSDSLNHHWAAAAAHPPPAVGRETYCDNEIRSARRFAPEAADELKAISEETSSWFSPASTHRESEQAFECVDRYVRSRLWRQAYDGKVGRDELLTYANLSGQDYSPAVLLQRASENGDECVKECGALAGKREAGKRYREKCAGFTAELAKLTAGEDQRAQLAALRADLTTVSNAAEHGRWLHFFAVLEPAQRLADQAHQAAPDNADIDDARRKLAALAAQHADKRARLARLDHDEQIQAMMANKQRLADARRLAELSLQDEDRILHATAPRTSWDARGGSDSDPGDPAAHDRAEERARLLQRRIADIDQQDRQLDDAIDRRCAEIGL